MKLNAAKIQEAEAWVEKNGLHPQACGATIKDFCKAMGIDRATFGRWGKNATFASALTRAREVFAQTTVREVSNALVKAARGVDFTKIKEEAKAETIVEFDPQTGKKIRERTGELKTVKAYRETVYFQPDTKAAMFVLTNLDPENWKNKQEHTLEATGVNIQMELPQEAIDGLSHAIDTGAQPRPPKEEE